MGAWIETGTVPMYQAFEKSHPTWVRGLKQGSSDLLPAELESHPTWVRGLKRFYRIAQCQWRLVAPYVGAWIETFTIGKLK